MKKTLAILLALVLALASFSVAAIAEPEQVLHLSWVSNPDNEFDFRCPWQDSNLVYNLLWMTLLEAGTDLTPAHGEIMSDWNISEDGLTYTFTLNEDLKWSDGTPITMDDVVWSIERNAAYSYWAYVYTALTFVEGQKAFADGEADSLAGLTVDGNTLTIKLSQPSATFINLMCQLVVLPKAVYEPLYNYDDPAGWKVNETWRTIKVNSGMYVVTEQVEGNYFVLEPNPYYPGEEPNIKKVIVTWNSDPVIAAQSGVTDFVTSNVADVYAAMKEDADFTFYSCPIIFFRFLQFNFFDAEGNHKNIVEDVRVRKAFAEGINWADMIDAFYGELASLTQTGVLSSDPAYIGDWYSYDPEDAKALLEEAGFPFDHTLKCFYYYSDQTTADIMDAIASDLAEIGVKFEGVYTSNPNTDIYEGRTHDLGYFGLSAFDNTSWYEMFLRPNYQPLMACGPVYEDAVAELKSATTTEAWNEALVKLQNLDKENIFLLPVYTVNFQWWIRNNLQGPQDHIGNSWYYFDYDFASWQITE